MKDALHTYGDRAALIKYAKQLEDKVERLEVDLKLSVKATQIKEDTTSDLDAENKALKADNKLLKAELYKYAYKLVARVKAALDEPTPLHIVKDE